LPVPFSDWLFFRSSLSFLGCPGTLWTVGEWTMVAIKLGGGAFAKGKRYWRLSERAVSASGRARAWGARARERMRVMMLVEARRRRR
jgi:hypothetical protein